MFALARPAADHRRGSRRVAATTAGLVAAVLSTALLAAPARAADLPDRIPVPDAAAVTGELAKYPAGRYIVSLVEKPTATYAGGIAGYAATKPAAGEQLDASSAAVQRYAAYLKQKQTALLRSVGANSLYRFTAALNGFAAELSSVEAARLAGSSEVAAVTPEELLHPTAETSTDYLGLSGANGTWSAVGGIDEAGEGVVVGVLDTGIAPENPSFAGAPLGSTASKTQPYLKNGTVYFAKADGRTFRSETVTGEQWELSDYSSKIIGANYFVDGFGADYIGGADLGEYLSPRDGDSHGSHTASTAAGNNGIAASVEGIDFGTISGVAPAAKIAAYKVCWTGQDPTVTSDDGCATTDLVAGIDQAITDGVDVINYSIGGGAATTAFSPTDEAFLNAAAAGIFVSASAGNDGPGASTLDNAAPWTTTVAASTIPDYEGTVELGDGSKFVGASLTVRTPVSGAFLDAGAHGATGVDPAEAALCAPESLGPDVIGTIVLCDRGGYDRVAKSAEVARAGGIGMVLVNVPGGADDVDNDFHSVPTVHIHNAEHAAVHAYAATPGATATLVPGNTSGVETPVPQLAGFSSHGPVLAAGSDVIKPDVAAPGVSILAAGSNPADGSPTWEFLSGTSMAAPHVAGLAALYLGEHPIAKPTEVKSALMTTATDLVTATGEPYTDPFGQGAGQVNARAFLEPGLTYNSTLKDWVAYLVGAGEIAPVAGVKPIDPSDLNLASIAIGDLTGTQTVTRKVTSTEPGSYRASVSVAGVTATVSPAVLTFTKANQTKSFTVTFTNATAPLDEWATGELTWTKADGSTTVRSPIAVHPTTVQAPDVVSGSGTAGSASVEIVPGVTGSIDLDVDGLAAGVVTPNEGDPAAGYTDIATAEAGAAAYVHEVAPTAEFARFAVVPQTEDGVDLDLYVFYRSDFSPDLDDYELVAQSATGAPGETVDLTDPASGVYITYVDYYSTPAGGVPYADIQYVLDPATDVGGFTASPDPVPVTAGTPASYDFTWSGLTAGTSYLGFVGYGDTPVVTEVNIAG